MKTQLINPEIRFETTNFCNYKCQVCPRDKMTRPKGTMDLGLFERLVDEGVKAGLKYVILTSFGEPLMDKYFIQRVKIVKKYGLYVAIDTNGFLLNEDLSKELIDLRFDDIRVSVFGTNPEIYKKMMGFDGYKCVVSNIENLLLLRKEMDLDFPKVGVYYAQTDENKEFTKEFIELWEGKVDEVSVWKAHNWINTYKFRGLNGTRKKTCGRPINGPLQIRWNGDVSACCFDFNNSLITGNLSEGGYEDFYNDPRYKQMKAAHQKGDLAQYPLCENCDQLYDLEDILIYSTQEKNKVGTSGNTFIEFEEN